MPVVRHTHVSLGLPPEIWAAVGVSCIYAATTTGYLSSADGKIMFWQAVALALHHSIHFPSPVQGPGSLIWNSKYGIGLSLLYLPGILLTRLIDPTLVAHAIRPTSPSQWELFAIAGTPVQIGVTVATTVLVSVLVRELGSSRRWALAAMLMYGIASPAFVYARLDFAQPLEGLCYVLAIVATLRANRLGSDKSRWVAACASILAVLTRPVEGTLLLPAILLTARGRKSRLIPIAGYLLGIAVTLLVNWLRFSSPLTTGYGAETFTTPLWVGLAGALLSPGRGLAWALPVSVFSPLGVRYLLRRGSGAVTFALVYLCIGLLLLVSAWNIWWGGYDWGLRLYLPAMPVVVALGTLGLAALEARVARIFSILVGGLGAFWCLPGVVENGYLYEVMANGTKASWALSAYPPSGAWQFFEGWLGRGTVGHTAYSDILWLVLAPASNGITIVFMFLLLLAGIATLSVSAAAALSPAGS